MTDDLDAVLTDFYRSNVNRLASVPRLAPLRVQTETQLLHGGPRERETPFQENQLRHPPVLAAKPPTISSISPDFSTTDGGKEIEITGTALNSGTLKVTLVHHDGREFDQPDVFNISPDGTTAWFTTTSSDENGNVDVRVSNETNETTRTPDDTLEDGLFYAWKLRIDVIDPNDGPASGGQAVTLYGQGFRPSDLMISFGANDVGTIVINPAGTQASIGTPAHVEGSVDVTATSPVYEDEFVYPLGYTYGGTAGIVYMYIIPQTIGDGQDLIVEVRASGTAYLDDIITAYNGVATITQVDQPGFGIFLTAPTVGQTLQFTNGIAHMEMAFLNDGVFDGGFRGIGGVRFFDAISNFNVWGFLFLQD